jgi:integrase
MGKRVRVSKDIPNLYKQATKQGLSFYAKFSFDGDEHSIQLVDRSDDPIRDEDYAITTWKSALELLREGVYPFKQAKRIDDWIAEYLKFWKPPRNAPATHKDKSIRLGHWLRWTKEHYPRAVYLGDLTAEMFEAFQEREGVSAVSVNADFRYLRHAVKWAVERDWLPKSPLDRIKRLPEAKRPKKTLDPGTIAKVFKHLNPVARAAWAFCSDTGVRPGEMFALKWSEVNCRERKASYSQGKTGKVKTVWFSEQTKKLIEAIPPQGPTVFYNTKGDPFNRQSWRDTVYRAADAAKVMKWGDGKRSGHKRIIWGTPPNPYALRHTVTTAMLEDSDIATVRDAMGHSSLSVTNIYAHSSEERIKAAFERLQKRKR